MIVVWNNILRDSKIRFVLVLSYANIFMYRGYESGLGARAGGGGCSGIFCWNNRRPQRRGKVCCFKFKF